MKSGMELLGLVQSLDVRYQRWKSRNLIFGDFHRPIRKSRVNLYYWRPSVGDNVGDLLSLVLVRAIVESMGLDFEKRTSGTRRLLAIGSILEQAVEDATVWGSGLRHSILCPQGMALDLRAVRGPLTREALTRGGYDCPEVFGDPAVLFPRFYRPSPAQARPFLVVPHFSREQDLLEAWPHHTISTRTSDWRGFVDAIASAELVISGSLHGIILAEAYGVPAIWLASAMDRDAFKYEDYYQGTGRRRYDVALTVEQALTLGGQAPPALDACQEALLKAFPRDLWES
jgi:pyruvyltransferase